MDTYESEQNRNFLVVYVHRNTLSAVVDKANKVEPFRDRHARGVNTGCYTRCVGE
jgi:hypothetical protein